MKSALAVFLALWGLASAAAERPTVFLIGDSTVRNGRGDGAGELWGWGDFLGAHFDSNKIRVANRALGGRSSRTFLTEGLWEKVRAELKPGDFVLMQFGHNDGGELFRGTRPRASLKGNGDESRDGTVEQTGKAETVQSYGWYLRHYISEAKAAGATPAVLSPVPRNIWKDGKVTRASGDYGKWAMEAAKAESVAFVNLNGIIARRYEELGEPKVRAELFTEKDHTHTTRAGAMMNAECVVEGIKANNLSLAKMLVTNAPPFNPAQPDPADHFRSPGGKARGSAKPDGN
jgi:lysophospholipase L1-like esterase